MRSGLNNFSKLLENSEKIGNDLKSPDAFRQRSSICRTITECTRRFPKGVRLFFISDLYRVITEFAEVQTRITRSFLKWYINVRWRKTHSWITCVQLIVNGTHQRERPCGSKITDDIRVILNYYTSDILKRKSRNDRSQ